jgi:Immunoglobulin V-set domain.
MQYMLIVVCCFDISFQEKQPTSNVNTSYNTAKNYKGRLVISNATYADTGYYFCVSNETAECNIKMEAAKRKYIYVKGQYQDMLMSLLSCNVDGFLTRNLE